MLDYSDKIFAILHHLRLDYWDFMASHNRLAEANDELILENVSLKGGCNCERVTRNGANSGNESYRVWIW